MLIQFSWTQKQMTVGQEIFVMAQPINSHQNNYPLLKVRSTTAPINKIAKYYPHAVILLNVPQSLNYCPYNWCEHSIRNYISNSHNTISLWNMPYNVQDICMLFSLTSMEQELYWLVSELWMVNAYINEKGPILF